MSALERIAFFVGRRDEIPNQELAARLAAERDVEGIGEIAANLHHSNPSIASDCLKVLYEIGYLAPDLIAPYADTFLELLQSRKNRMVWGAMIALATITRFSADTLYPHRHAILAAMANGTVITVDAGVQALAGIASERPEYRVEIAPVLLAILADCRPKDVPRHAERIIPALDEASRKGFVNILRRRLPELTKAGATRARRVLRQLGD